MLFLIIILLLAGCFNSVGVKETKKTGSIKVDLDVPSSLSPQFVSYDLILSSITVTVTKDSTSYSKTVSVRDEIKQVVFDNLFYGDWEIEVTAKDSQGYDVYCGQSSAVVSSDSVTQVTVDLELKPGDLEVQVSFPDEIDVASGKVTLVNAVNSEINISSNLVIDEVNNQGTATLSEVQASTWLMEIQLLNSSSEEIGEGNSYIDILPGRTTTADIIAGGNGSLDIRLSWGLMPLAPTGLNAVYQNSNVVLTWNSNSEVDIAGYFVYRSLSEFGEKELLTDSIITDTTFTDDTVDENLTYWYWVQVFNTKGYSSDLSKAFSINLNDPISGPVNPTATTYINLMGNLDANKEIVDLSYDPKKLLVYDDAGNSAWLYLEIEKVKGTNTPERFDDVWEWNALTDVPCSHTLCGIANYDVIDFYNPPAPQMPAFSKLNEGSIAVHDREGNSYVEGVDFTVDYERAQFTWIGASVIGVDICIIFSYRTHVMDYQIALDLTGKVIQPGKRVFMMNLYDKSGLCVNTATVETPDVNSANGGFFKVIQENNISFINGSYGPSVDQIAEVYDALGNKYNVTMEFVKAGANCWDWFATVKDMEDNTIETLSNGGTINFDQQGKVLSVTGENLILRPDNVQPVEITLNFLQITQFAGGFNNHLRSRWKSLHCK